MSANTHLSAIGKQAHLERRAQVGRRAYLRNRDLLRDARREIEAGRREWTA